MRAIPVLLIMLFSSPALSYSFHDISSIKDVKQKKNAFFSHLYPAVLSANKKIIKERKFIVDCDDKCQQSSVKYMSLLSKYKSANITDLIDKVDIIPMDLALNQAANESSWGGSRFSKVANNLFGMWCFSPGCGVVPLGRPSGESYEVRKYESVDNSIEHYMLTLNTHNAYLKLRDIRSEQRKCNHSIDASKLSEGLLKYSARKEDYVLEIQSMIRINKKFIDSSNFCKETRYLSAVRNCSL